MSVIKVSGLWSLGNSLLDVNLKDIKYYCGRWNDGAAADYRRYTF
jgi:hypothetical protein